MDARPEVVCAGILVADAIARPVDALPPKGGLSFAEEIVLRGGGCALNTASGLRRLGLEVAVAGKVGVDTFGDFLLGLLASRGISAAGVVRDPAARTAASVVLVSEDGERSFIHVKGASAELRADELDPEVLFAGSALHLAGTLVMDSLDGEPAAGLLAGARARGLLTSADTAFDATGRWHRALPVLAHADVFCASLLEAQAITGEQEPAAAAAWLRAHGAHDVAVKLGPDGCYVAGEGFAGAVPPVAVRAVDGTGAGDAFVAGLLWARLAGRPLEEQARIANAAGALATTAVGASDVLPTLEEVLAASSL